MSLRITVNVQPSATPVNPVCSQPLEGEYMNFEDFTFVDKHIEKPELQLILDRLDNCLGTDQFISHFFTQKNLRDRKDRTISIETLLVSSYIEKIMHAPTARKIPPYRELIGFEVEGCLANILFRGTCQRSLSSSYLEASELANKCIRSIYQERTPHLIGYYFESGWSNWFIGEEIIDTTLLVFCPGRQFWWLFCLTETD